MSLARLFDSTPADQLEALEGLASEVRQVRLTQISTDRFGPLSTDSYECVFRLSGAPVVLRTSNPIFIEDGEAVRVVGEYNQNGVFDAEAYHNRSAGVSGKSPDPLFEICTIGLMMIVALGAAFFFMLFNGSFDLTLGAMIVIIELILISRGYAYVMRTRIKRHMVDDLLKNAQTRRL